MLRKFIYNYNFIISKKNYNNMNIIIKLNMNIDERNINYQPVLEVNVILPYLLLLMAVEEELLDWLF